MRAESRTIRVTVNGMAHERETEVRTLLCDFIRHDVHATGTHVGCEHGVCGACTVLIDGEAVRSCLMLAPQADGHEISTVEGLAKEGELHPLQESFRRNHGLQCGFCTPGILMSVVAAANSGESLDQVLVEVLGAHLCRCTGYVNVRAAIIEAWRRVVDSG